MVEGKVRNFVHKPFARMPCPIAGCTQLNGGPEEGTVPGIKRHVRSKHKDQYDTVVWPPIYDEVSPNFAPLPSTATGPEGTFIGVDQDALKSDLDETPLPDYDAPAEDDGEVQEIVDELDLLHYKASEPSLEYDPADFESVLQEG